MKRMFVSVLLSVFTVCFSTAEELKLWYAQPAEKWVEALPLGNFVSA